MQQLLSIVGTTATGKTKAAFHIAHEILEKNFATGVDIISADSRQVYQGLSVITGADIPPNATQISDRQFSYPLYVLEDNRIRVHGISIIPVLEEWSLAEFQRMAWEIMRMAERDKRAVFVVGGTGLYQTQLLNPEIARLPQPDDRLRTELSPLTLDQLQKRLALEAPKAWQAMNDSDRANSRRLIRAIERATTPVSEQTVPNQHLDNWSQHIFWLEIAKESLVERIKQRVRARLNQYAVDEALQLRLRCEELSLSPIKVQSFTSCGVRECLAYADEVLTFDECVDLWTRHEVSYAKRQLTWWKKQPVDFTLSVSEADWLERLVEQALPLFS